MYGNDYSLWLNGFESQQLWSGSMMEGHPDQFRHSLPRFTTVSVGPGNYPQLIPHTQETLSRERFLASESDRIPVESYAKVETDDPNVDCNTTDQSEVHGEVVTLKDTGYWNIAPSDPSQQTVQETSRLCNPSQGLRDIEVSSTGGRQLQKQGYTGMSMPASLYYQLEHQHPSSELLPLTQSRGPYQLSYSSEPLMCTEALDAEGLDLREHTYAHLDATYRGYPFTQSQIIKVFDSISQHSTTSGEQTRNLQTGDNQAYGCMQSTSMSPHVDDGYTGLVGDADSIAQTNKIGLWQENCRLGCANVVTRVFDHSSSNESQSSKGSLATSQTEFDLRSLDSEANSGDEVNHCHSPSFANLALSKTLHKLKSDEFLVKARKAGWSYREIRAKGQFHEVESTLRGRYRNLTKARDSRVRKPVWTPKDVELLMEAVDQFAPDLSKLRDSKANVRSKISKAPWKEVAQYIQRKGGSYCFGYATCRKRWDELTHSKS